MANPIKWSEVAALTSYLTTELNALADEARKLGGEIDNADSASRYTFVVLELLLGVQGSARDSGAYVAVYLLKSADGTNYEYGGDAQEPPSGAWATNFTVDAATTSRRIVIEVPIPPCKFKLLFVNETGQAFAATGNTVKYGLYSLEVT